ncbi:MAG: hypothetical protein N3A02_08560, partial [Rectinema sp.]|nr:hypothetical protein [Rectinema sp.]
KRQASGRPFAALAVQLGAGSLSGTVEVVDKPVYYPALGRITSLNTSAIWSRPLLPIHRTVRLALDAGCAMVQKSYPASNIFLWAPDYFDWTAGLAWRYSSMHASRAYPGLMRGVSVELIADWESAGAALWGISAGGSSQAAEGLFSVRLSGAARLAGSVSFMPGGRRLSNGIDAIPSMRSVPWRSYAEYTSLDTDAPWFVQAEGMACLLRIEAGWIIPLPLMPSIAVRRMTGSIGLRGAGIELSGQPAALSSAFLRLDTDMAILAGLAASVHSVLSVEAAFLFNPEHANGARYKVFLGFSNYY